jgi:aryl-alcohol dehydrogenase-like predicted oxidoreductase
LLALAGQLGKAPSQVALAWLLSRTTVSSVIFGARTVAQLEENLGAGDLELSAEAVASLDAASAFEFGYPYEFIKNIDGAW